MKKFISFTLILAMLLALMPLSVFATTEGTEGLKYTLIVDGTYYIVSGYEGTATEVVIPSTYNGKPVKEIGNYAFSSCDSLTSITIPDSVTTIGEYAFYSCDSLTSVTIGNSVTTIGEYAFERCYSLTSITIPDSVTTIGDATFSDCSNLTSITIPDSVTTIGNRAFEDCTSLTSITIPDSVATIGAEAFYRCENLTSVTIGNSVTTIGNRAFEDCTSLTSITIGDSVTIIGWDAFRDCTSITNITIPNSVTSIGGYAFSDCNALETIVVEEGNAVYHSAGNCLIKTATKTLIAGCKNSIIPTDGSVTTIGEAAFSGCDSLTSIIIPDSVTTIGDYAFYECRLTNITIPDSVTTIGEVAFFYAGLTDIYCEVEAKPAGWSSPWCATRYDEVDGVFYGYVTIHWGYTGTEGLEYTLSDDGTHYIVSDYTGSATEVVIPSTYDGLPVEEIGNSAFSWCNSLTSITIPDSVTTIVAYAFIYCDSLTSITIPDSVTTIESLAFSGCSSLASINIPSSVTTIGIGVFYGCSALETIVVDSGNASYHSAGNCIIETAAKTLVVGCKNSVIPADGSVTTIGRDAFSSCDSLTSITIPDSVTTIGDAAFYRCDSLTSITIPDSVTTIGAEAFSYCYNLTSITIPDSVTTIGSLAFFGCDNLAFNVYNNAKYLGNGSNPHHFLVEAVSEDITSCNIHSKTKVIVGHAFSYCDSLTSITIPDSVTTIGDHAFYWCESLTSVTIGNSVTTIGESTFSGCDSLTSATIGNSVTTIGDFAFYDCENLTSITIPDSVTTIGEWAFYWCDNLTDIYCEAEEQPSDWSDDWNYGCDATVHWGYKPAPVKITTQPKNVSVQSGKTAKVTVTATGDGLKYKWYFKNKGDSKFSLTTTFTGNTYSAEMNSTRAGRQVYCVITDKYGNSVKTNTVTLGMAVKITTQPKTVAVQSGKTAKVTVTATGDGLKYKWYFKNKGASSFSLTTTFTGNTYSATMDSTRAGRQVYCVITDKYGNSVKTNTVTLGMAVKITTQPKTVAVQTGKTAKVTVTATGDGLKYKWYFKNKGASSFSLTTTFTGNTYSATMDSTRAGRQVYCVITDKYGNSVKTNTVTLGMAVKITTQPTSVKVANGKTAKVTVKASGDGLTYKWYFKDKGASKFSLTNTFKGATYSATMTNARAGRQVYCVITDKYGNSVKTNTVTLNKK